MNSDAAIYQVLSIRADEEISQQITGTLKDCFTILLYFQRSCLKVISGNWHHRALMPFWCWCVNGSNMDKRWKAIACVNSRCSAFRGKVTLQFYSNLTGLMCESGKWKKNARHATKKHSCSMLAWPAIQNSAQERVLCEPQL